MPSYSIYQSQDQAIYAYSNNYSEAREGSAGSTFVSDSSPFTPYVGQRKPTSAHYCEQLSWQFDTSGVLGGIQSATLQLHLNAVPAVSVTIEMREKAYVVGDAGFVAGSAMSGHPLLGSKTFSGVSGPQSMPLTAANVPKSAAFGAYMAGANQRLSVAPTGDEFVEVRGSGYADEPYLSIATTLGHSFGVIIA